LAKECNSFTEVGRIFGITKWAVSKTYTKRLAPYLPQKGGYDRKRTCTIARHQAKPLPEFPLEVWKEARKHGILVARSLSVVNSKYRTQTRELLLNDKLSKIRFLRNKVSCKAAVNCAYAHAQISVTSLSDYKFQIIVVEVEGFARRYFVIPSEVIAFNRKSYYSQKRRCEEYYINLPLQKVPIYKNIKPITDWWQYENAWNLLKDVPMAEV